MMSGAAREAAVFAYRLVFATTMLAAAIAVAFAYAPAEMKDVNFPKAAKFDFLRSQPVVECPQMAWPYGCEWRPLAGSPPKHLVQRRGRHYRPFE